MGHGIGRGEKKRPGYEARSGYSITSCSKKEITLINSMAARLQKVSYYDGMMVKAS